MRKTRIDRTANSTQGEQSDSIAEEAQAEEGSNGTAALILDWASERHIRRRRDDRSYGHPDAHWAGQWALYCKERGIREREAIFRVMDAAKSAADGCEQWRFWKYLDEQVQQAAERYLPPPAESQHISEPTPDRPIEDPNSEWARVKCHLSGRLHPVGYANWVNRTCQIDRHGTTLRVWIPDEVTRDWLENDYAPFIAEALATVGFAAVEYTRRSDHSAVVKAGSEPYRYCEAFGPG